MLTSSKKKKQKGSITVPLSHSISTLAVNLCFKICMRYIHMQEHCLKMTDYYQTGESGPLCAQGQRKIQTRHKED